MVGSYVENVLFGAVPGELALGIGWSLPVHVYFWLIFRGCGETLNEASSLRNPRLDYQHVSSKNETGFLTTTELVGGAYTRPHFHIHPPSLLLVEFTSATCRVHITSDQVFQCPKVLG